MSACIASPAEALQPQSRGERAARNQGRDKLMEAIRSLDSQSFGFLDFHRRTAPPSLKGATSATSFVSKELLQEGVVRLRRELSAGASSQDGGTADKAAETFCQLGHLHLLLEEHSQALSAYQRYQALSPASQTNPRYHYGLGLIYYHLKAHKWAIDAFHCVLELSPAFACAADVHLRLGVVYKREAEFRKSSEHFEKALLCPGEASFSKLEIQFHVAHLCHLQGRCEEARERFEAVLAAKSLPTNIRSITLRQLGWLYHTAPSSSSSSSLSSDADSTSKAIELLNLSIGADPTSGQAWYFLGRCHSAQGHAHEAFMAYQQAVEKSGSEEQADVWCSIGLLYHNMGQPKDALQSYLCAVYLNAAHSSAWSDIGCLYEAVAQPVDALLCYKNSFAARNKKPEPNKDPVSPDYVLSRIACLESYVSAMSGLLATQPRPLPALDEAWRSLIPSHIRSRHPAPTTPILTLSDLHLSSIPSSSSSLPTSTSFTSLPLPAPHTAPPLTKRQRLHRRRDPIIVSSLGDVWSQAVGGIPPGISPGNSPGFAFPPGVFPTPINSVPVLATGMGNGNATGMELSLSSVSEINGMDLSPAFSEQSSSGCGLMGGVTPMQQLAALRRQSAVQNGVALPDNVLCSSSLAQPGSVCSQATSSSDGLFSPESVSGGVGLEAGSGSLRSGRAKRRRSRSQQVHVVGALSPCGYHPHTLTPSPSGSHYPHTVTPSPSGSHYPHTVTPSPSGSHHPHTVTGIQRNGLIVSPSSVAASQNLPLSFYPGIASPSLSSSTLDSHSITRVESNFGSFNSHNVNIPFSSTLPSDLAKVNPLAINSRHIDERISDYLIDNQDRGYPRGLDDIGERLSEPISKNHSRKTTMSSNVSNEHRSKVTNNERVSEDATTHLGDNISDSSSGVSSSSMRSNRPSFSSISPKTTPPSSTMASVDKCFTFRPRNASEKSANGSTTMTTENEMLIPIEEPFPCLFDEAEYMLQDPELRPPKAPPSSSTGDSKTKLNLEVPIYHVKSRPEDSESQELHAFCGDPALHICMVRGLCAALEMNLDLYSSRTLTQTCPNHEIEVREQRLQAAAENWDAVGRRLVWRCESTKSLTTVGEYSAYQTRVLLAQEDLSLPDNVDPPPSDGQSNRLRPKQRKMLRFGTNVDLSSEGKWSAQISELNKLPKFLRVSCPEANFLTHIGHTILGMNSVQLYMKVTGSRTPGHQENNNFCSVNVNIGPGTCEWFAVPNQYWGAMHDLCEKHRLSFLIGSWWPVLEELAQLGVPVYRFTQLVGDLVWINPGTVHWVQANGVCNNIAWNIGPLTAHQFRMSWERYQWNKVQKVRSIVPMIHLSWNVARSLKLRDHTLYSHLRSLLESSLSHTQRLLKNLERAGIPVVWHGKEEGDQAPCCSYCLEELFNILFVLSHKGQNNVYCHKCAGGLKKSFTVLQQYKIEELQSILSSFKLHAS